VRSIRPGSDRWKVLEKGGERADDDDVRGGSIPEDQTHGYLHVKGGWGDGQSKERPSKRKRYRRRKTKSCLVTTLEKSSEEKAYWREGYVGDKRVKKEP